MKILLWVNTILEGLAGLLFLFFPGLVPSVPGLEELHLAGGAVLFRMYGVAALTLGIFSAFLLFRLKYYQEVLADGLLLFTLFHGGLTIVLFVFNHDFGPGVIHGVMALAFLTYYLKRP